MSKLFQLAIKSLREAVLTQESPRTFIAVYDDEGQHLLNVSEIIRIEESKTGIRVYFTDGTSKSYEDKDN